MRNIIYLILIVVLSSCSYHFELDEVDASEKLVLYCFPSNKDTTVIQLSRSVPVGKREPLDKSVRNADIHFTVNGKEQAIYWNEDSTSSLPAKCYYTLGKRGKNDCLQLQVASTGLPAITARTVMPDIFPLKEIRLAPRGSSENTLQVLVTFKDDEGSDDYYGIRMMKKQIRTEDNEEDVSFYSVEFDLKGEPLLDNQSDLDEIFMLSNCFFGNLYIWSDDKIQGKEYTLRLNMDYQKDFVYDWDNSSYREEYKIYLYKLSPEFYNYFKTLNNINNNDLGNHGLSPMFHHYTNVSNGIGVVGACQITETEWLKNVH